MNLNTSEYLPYHSEGRGIFNFKFSLQILNKLAWLFMVVLLSVPFKPLPGHQETLSSFVLSDWGKMPLVFIANQGQVDPRVAFYVKGRNKVLYFTDEGVTITLTNHLPKAHTPYAEMTQARPDHPERWNIKLVFVGANKVRPVGTAKTETIISYFIGAPSDWHTGLPAYSQIVYPNLWEGIDLIYSGTLNRLKYEFVVHPGADPNRIRLAYHGAAFQLGESGTLFVDTPLGGFQDDTPVAYQEIDNQRVPVKVSFDVEKDAYFGFDVDSYDPTLPLVIDPAVLIYCGYIGGGDFDLAYDIAVDTSGNAYVVGKTESTEATFPVVVGPDLTYNGGTYGDAFIAKVKADGTGFVYVGYLGSLGDDEAYGVAVDADGYAYITGIAGASSFPAIVGPDVSFNGDWDAFVAKVNPEGTGLVYSGFIGGNEEDRGFGISVDSSGNAYVVGMTYSSQGTFPETVGPDLTYNGNWDSFVAKVNADGTGLLYAGYIGGSDDERGSGIAVDTAGNAYIVGTTYSTETTFPVLGGPDLTFNGERDAFVVKVMADGTGLTYSGFIGGSHVDEGEDIAVDAAGNAYITGSTSSNETTFPVTGGPDLTHNGNADSFVAKVVADGSGLAFAGYIGGGSYDEGDSIVVDNAGNAYIAGVTYSSETTFPVIGWFDLTFNGVTDGFVTKVKSDGSGLVYSGYIGGSSSESAQAITVDSRGSVYIAGYTLSTQATFPVTIGPDLTYNDLSSGWDAFVAKISYQSPYAEFLVPTADSAPYGITTDGSNNIWFTETAGNKIGKLSSSNDGMLDIHVDVNSTITITEYTIPTTDSTPSDIVLGPDDNLWFTEYDGNKIGRITPMGTITEFTLSNANSMPIAITVGPDNNLWFCEEGGNRIGKMNVNGTILAEYDVPTPNSGLNDIVAGPDGALWFTEYNAKKIGRITTNGVITEYSVGGKVFGITSGIDGNLWFTETIANRVGKISTGGVVTEYDLPGGPHGPMDIVAGPFNSLWVAANFSNKVLRILLSGITLSEYPIPTENSGVVMITTDGGGHLWFTEMNANQIGRLTPSGGTLYLPLIRK